MKLSSILSGVVVFGLLAILFAPLIVVDSQFFPYISGKGFVFRIAVEVLFVLWLILAVRDRKFLPRFSWTFVAVSVFLLVVALADAFGLHPYKSFWSNYERMEGLITLIHLWLYFIVA